MDLGSEGGVAVSVLGPLTVRLDGRQVDLSVAAGKVLGLLALQPERLVPKDEIAEVLWPQKTPDAWRNLVHVHVNRLRATIEPDRRRRAASRLLVSVNGAYRLNLDCVTLDLARFDGFVNAARRATERGDDAAALHLYAQALACWRGPVLAGGDFTLRQHPSMQAIQRRRLDAAIKYADLALQEGDPAQAMPWLLALSEDEPLHEGLHARLMLSMARSGEPATALQLFVDLRSRLAEQLGIDPGAELQAAYQQVVNGAPVPREVLPHQLPPGSPQFEGREEDVRALLSMLGAEAAPRGARIAATVVIHGLPGIGKTSLAVEVARLCQDSYPDGTLFADLRGESPQHRSPDDVLADFIRALGVTGRDIPDGRTDRINLFRTLMSRRKVLLVLDDAGTAEQVSPLLPANPMSAAVITTRRALPELGLTHYLVEPLPEQASLAVLAAYLSPERVSAERDAALDVSTYCGGLPLALRIAAARLNRGMWIADLARLLHDAQHRLSELDTGRQALRAGLESLVQTLSATERQTLTQLARLPTHIIAGWAPALACRSAREAFRVISALEGAQLVTPLHQLQPGRPQRYTLHGLVRLFAAESKGGDPELDDISQAVGSVWFELGRRAIVQLSTRHLDPAGLCHADVTSIDQSHVAWVDENPLRWFDDEVGQLTDTLRDAAERGWHRLAAGLLNVLGGYFRIRHMIEEWRTCNDIAAVVTETGSDGLARGYVAESETSLLLAEEKFVEAERRAETCRALFRAEGDRRGEARATYHLAFTRRRLGDPQSALGLTEQALATYVELGDVGGQAAAHQALGVLYKDYLIDLDKSEQHLLAAFQLVSDRPDDRGVGQVMFSLGLLYTAQERVFDAMAMFRQALERVRRNNDSIGVATVLRGLGALLVNHNPADAGALLAEAASISRQIGNRGTLAEVLRWQAELAERAGRIRAAIDYLREAKDLLATLGFSKEHEALSTRLATLEARRRSSLTQAYVSLASHLARPQQP